MKLFDNEVAGAGGACVVGESTCRSQSDVEDARQVAFGLGLANFTFNFTGTFWLRGDRSFLRCVPARSARRTRAHRLQQVL